MNRRRRFLPLGIVFLVAVVSYVTTFLPQWWTLFLRFAMLYGTLAILVWGCFQAKRYRDELHAHRLEIVEMISSRSAEVAHLKQAATELAAETARVAAELSTRKLDAIQATGEETNVIVKEVAEELK